MPLPVFAKDIVDGSSGLIDEIMGDQIERLSDLNAS